MRRFLRLLALASLLIIAGCTSGGSIATSSPSPKAQGANPPPGQSTGTTNVCALVSLGDVQAHSPFSTPLASAAKVAGGGCYYTATVGATNPDSVGLSVLTFSSMADALTALHSHEQLWSDRGTPPQAISGVGNAASGCCAGSDEATVVAVLGTREIAASMKGEWPDVDGSQKIVAETALVKLIISRLR